jgi:hypothetical protein
MEFRTEVEVDNFPFSLGYATPTLFCGSCFTENIGGIMRTLKMPVLVNPFGVVYNPISVAQVLQRSVAGKTYNADELQFRDGLWFSFDFHSRFASPDRNACLTQLNEAVSSAKVFIETAQCILATFGTARVYKLKDSGEVVSNCHKVPAVEFEHKLLTVDEVVEIWSNLITMLLRLNPSLKFILTVSPIRHWKDGAIGNQLSKSTLIVAVHRLVEIYSDKVFYFPGYELMMDDLRDYRFYDDDMLHPSPKAIEYIWNKFSRALVDNDSMKLAAQIQKIIQAAGHRPFNPNTLEHKRFVDKILKAIQDIKLIHPSLNFEREIAILKGEQ